MKTLILDNYDSFTFNLYQEIGELGGYPLVKRNDEIGINELDSMNFTHFVISPGPGNPYTPRDIGISEELIDYAAKRHLPLLGVCLGHQILGKHFGAVVARAPSAEHGKAFMIKVLVENPLFKGLEKTFEAMRYHSLCVLPESMPDSLQITAATEDSVIMALQHKRLPLFGVQFHPESIGTPHGKDLLHNFLSL